jgi:hypothetical protein
MGASPHERKARRRRDTIMNDRLNCGYGTLLHIKDTHDSSLANGNESLSHKLFAAAMLKPKRQYKEIQKSKTTRMFMHARRPHSPAAGHISKCQVT